MLENKVVVITGSGQGIGKHAAMTFAKEKAKVVIADFNAELAKKTPACLEYVVVHELVHLLEPTHNARFIALMDRFLPKWQFHRQVLNRLPVRQERWSY